MAVRPSVLPKLSNTIADDINYKTINEEVEILSINNRSQTIEDLPEQN